MIQRNELGVLTYLTSAEYESGNHQIDIEKVKKEGGNSWKITQKSRKWPNSQACGIPLQ